MSHVQKTRDLRRRPETIHSPEEGPTRAEENDDRERLSVERIVDFYQRQQQLIAYEIHDGVVQKATAALLHFEAFQALQGRNAERAQKALDSTMEALRQSIEEARWLIAGVRPSMLEEGGLIPAISRLTSDGRILGGARIELSISIRIERLIPPLEHAAFRIIQECLSNAQRHSQSERIQVTITERGDWLRLEVEDWGIGFRPEDIPPRHFGLEGVQQRATLFGGHAHIDSAPGRGTHITVELPLVEDPTAERAAEERIPSDLRQLRTRRAGVA